MLLKNKSIYILFTIILLASFGIDISNASWWSIVAFFTVGIFSWYTFIKMQKVYDVLKKVQNKNLKIVNTLKTIESLLTSSKVEVRGGTKDGVTLMSSPLDTSPLSEDEEKLISKVVNKDISLLTSLDEDAIDIFLSKRLPVLDKEVLRHGGVREKFNLAYNLYNYLKLYATSHPKDEEDILDTTILDIGDDSIN